MPADPRGLTLAELTAAFTAAGRPAYRAEQVLRWLHRGAATYDAMTNLPLADRVAFARDWPFVPLRECDRISRPDGTVKFLWELADGTTIESVVLPGTRGRGTLCVSSQVGCALRCAFCATGQQGFVRDLTAAEIVDQAIRARALGFVFSNIVLMGMGEPLLNYANVMQAVRILNEDAGLNFGRRRVTISTAGIPAGIRALARDPLRVRLTVSLNATTDAVRARLMPVTQTSPLAELLEACREYSRLTEWWMTFAYVLCAGVNDSEDDAERLVDLTDGILRKINLITVNAVAGSELQPPAPAVVERFAERLRARGISTTVRRSVGSDIDAACGQLRGRRDPAPAAARRARPAEAGTDGAAGSSPARGEAC